jgi:hypothetical protein
MSIKEAKRLNKNFPIYRQSDGIWIRRIHQIADNQILIIKIKFLPSGQKLNYQCKLVRVTC